MKLDSSIIYIYRNHIDVLKVTPYDLMSQTHNTLSTSASAINSFISDNVILMILLIGFYIR